MLKLTPAGVNTGPISKGVNLIPFWCYFNTFRCFSSPRGCHCISTPKSVEITPNGVKLTPLEIGPILTPAGVNLTPEFLQCIRFENTSKYVDTLTLFSKNLNQRSLTLDDLWTHVCWGHMCDSTQGPSCPSPMTIHQWMWIQWSILQNTTYIHTYIRTYYVQNEWSHSLLLNSVQARQKAWFFVKKLKISCSWDNLNLFKFH